MTARLLPEWIGKTPDSLVPPRVRLRVFDRCDGRCGCCNRKIMAGEAWDLEHTIAIINGGEHRESNMRPWLSEHHKEKTRTDVAEKSAIYGKRLKHVGIKKRSGRPIMGSKASGWKRKMNGELVRR